MKLNFLSLLIILVLISCDSSDGDELAPVIFSPSGIEHFDINNRGNASDIRLFFEFSQSIQHVREFRIILVPEGKQPEVSISSFLSASSQVQIVPAQQGEIKLTLNASLKDLDGNNISDGTAYAVAVASIHKTSEEDSKFLISNQSVTLTPTELKDLYISNSRGNSVVVIDEVTGELIGNFISPGIGGLGNTQELIINEAGNFLVTGVDNTAVKLYDGTTGAFIRDFTSGYVLGAPTKTSIGPDNLLYVSQWTNNINNVARFNYETGAFVDEYITGVDRAMGHAWDSDGNYYLALFGTPSVVKYDSQGNEVAKIGEGLLQGPVNVWVDESRNGLFVVDWSVGQVKEFDLTTGSFKANLVTGMQRVEGFLFGRDNALYLCDWQNNSVNEYDLTSGASRRVMQFDILNNPNGVIYGPNIDPN
ncbi:hypothetical protein BFP97_05235 [Roseivirga sp. 4D4]|uniref:Vgb family protein n=1 Tax=Roseivirga sp. 4D4 TaxID=1889784 RepID=UPI000852E0BB|nr:hypothetical protein [Roseivirga sp. 4D4]OEK00947.1 hypothetical protein BFP97_05235 [Roseivirga sp. 4D4]